MNTLVLLLALNQQGTPTFHETRVFAGKLGYRVTRTYTYQLGSKTLTKVIVFHSRFKPEPKAD